MSSPNDPATANTATHEAGRAELVRLSREAPLEIGARSFVFVRHGETDGNRLRIFQVAEQPLNANGLAQARSAAARLRALPIRRITASTQARAWRTAEIIAAPHSLHLMPSDKVRERWFGSLVGTPSVNLDWSYDPPGGERLADFVARTRAGLVEALAEPEGSMVVAHGGNLHVLANGLGLTLPNELGANASPILFERKAGAGNGWRASPIGPVNALIGIAS